MALPSKCAKRQRCGNTTSRAWSTCPPAIRRRIFAEIIELFS
jgi:hypothetical protein